VLCFGRARLGDVLRLEHLGLALALARLAQLVGVRLAHAQFGVGAGDVGLGLVLARDGLGVGLGHRDAHHALGLAHRGLALVARALLADRALLFELGHAHGALALGVLGADVAQL